VSDSTDRFRSFEGPNEEEWRIDVWLESLLDLFSFELIDQRQGLESVRGLVVESPSERMG
jgi:hypothetical protein